MIDRTKRGKSSIVIVLAVVVVLVLSSSFGISSLNQVEEELLGFKMELEEGLEIIKNKSYQVCNNVRWDEMKAAGIKLTQESWKGFLQICERLVFDFGNLQLYVDFEARVMWVYSDPSNRAVDTEVYYVQFT